MELAYLHDKYGVTPESYLDLTVEVLDDMRLLAEGEALQQQRRDADLARQRGGR